MPRLICRTLRRRVAAILAAWACCSAAGLAGEPLPTVASINVCADQHVLALADPEQILTVSWLAADPEESLFAAEARRDSLTIGTAAELSRGSANPFLESFLSDSTRKSGEKKINYH